MELIVEIVLNLIISVICRSVALNDVHDYILFSVVRQKRWGWIGHTFRKPVDIILNDMP